MPNRNETEMENETLKGVTEWERQKERDQTTYYSDVNLLTVRQTGELCHTGWTNGRRRNGATYDINAGMG